MRNKLKKIWNKEDGFTLVELLGVIVILGIILAIAIPGIGNIVESARTKTTAQEQELVIDAARLYFVENNKIAGEATVTVSDLEGAGFLDVKTDSKVKPKDSVKRDTKGNFTFIKAPAAEGTGTGTGTGGN